MTEIEELKDRIEKLEQEQKALRRQMLKFKNFMSEASKPRRQKPQIIVGPSEPRKLETPPTIPRPGHPFCNDEQNL